MEMMENPDGFTTFPQPPLTPFFLSDFLPPERIFFYFLGTINGAPTPFYGLRLSKKIIAHFAYYYSLSASRLQGRWTGFFPVPP